VGHNNLICGWEEIVLPSSIVSTAVTGTSLQGQECDLALKGEVLILEPCLVAGLGGSEWQTRRPVEFFHHVVKEERASEDCPWLQQLVESA